MCEITVTKYVRSDGTRHSVERKNLCYRSDGKSQPLDIVNSKTNRKYSGVNPCIFQTKQELTEFVPPSLDHNGGLSPPSTGGPGTPMMTATANYEIREPQQHYGSSSKGKGKAKTYGLSVNTSSKRKKTSRPGSGERLKSRYDDDDLIIAVEEGGRIRPVSPTTGRSPHGSPLSRPRRAPAIIHQTRPPLQPLDDPFRPLTTGSYHRRTSTAPGPIDFNPDNEIFDRANARDELRRQNRDRQHREDEDRQLAEVLQREENRKAEEKEAREKAADEFAMRDFQRLNERDRLREEARRKREAEEDHTDRRTREIKARQEREAQQKALDEARRQKEAQDEARRRQEVRDQGRQSYNQDRQERIIQEDLERRRREREQTNAMHMREIDEEVQRLDHELLIIQERSAARERALQLENDVREHDRLRDEIRQLEEEHRRETAPLPPQYASEVSDLEAELQRLNARIRARERDTASSIDGSLYDEPRRVGPAPPRIPTPRTPVSLQQASPFLDEEFRRRVGQQVLERERNIASQSSSLDTIGLSRRNTIDGGNRSREQHYRNLRRWYPE
jgi:hypothetical protein